MNILTVADEVIIPLEPGAFSLQGLSRLYKFIGQIHDFTNDKLKVDGKLWTAICDEDVGRNEVVEIVKIEGVKLKVRKK